MAVYVWTDESEVTDCIKCLSFALLIVLSPDTDMTWDVVVLMSDHSDDFFS